jgi:hypothetical protein
MTALRIAAVIHAVLGLGFGIGSVVTLRHLALHDELPMTPWGFRSMAGPAEALGRSGFVALGWTLVAVSAVDAVAGILLWRGRRGGAALAAGTALPTFGLGVAFALPFLLVAVPLRVALLIVGRRHLR